MNPRIPVIAFALTHPACAPATPVEAPLTVPAQQPAGSAGETSADPTAAPLPPLERFSAAPDDTGPFGYREPGGRVVIEPIYDLAEEFTPEGIAAVADDQGFAYIDRTGRVLVRPFNFDNGPDPFEDGLARFVEQGKFGFFDTHARVVIPARFDFACSFSEGLACFCVGCTIDKSDEHGVIRGGRWGYIDRSGAVVIPVEFDGPSYFTDGEASVRRGGVQLTIDRKGKVISR